MTATQPYRLASGGRIDRNRPVSLRFNGRAIHGFTGDTVASALLANGVSLVGRSFKFHRPRGIVSHGAEEPNALLQVDRDPGRVDPNVRATMLEASDGLAVASQHHWPSLGFDLGAINDWLAPMFTAGFYYKTFMWPRSFWDRIYEPLIRRAAGLGVAPTEPDPDRYVHRHVHCDLLVVGGGPAGLAAALAASASGQRIILADEQAEFGGALLHEREAAIEGMPAAAWLAQSLAALRQCPDVRLLPRSTAFGYYNHNHVGVLERVTGHLAAPSPNLPRERLWHIRAQRVVLATGAHERPLAFPGNDRPGIMLAESIRVYLNRYAVMPGRRIVFATNGASAWQAAADAVAAGIVATVVDLRPEADCGPGPARLRALGAEVLTGHTVLGSTGKKRVTGLIVAPVDADGRLGPAGTLACDAAGLSGGWTPAVHLFSQSRGTLTYDAAIDAWRPGRSAQAEQSAGAADGTYELAACLDAGWHAGLRATGQQGSRTFTVNPPTRIGFIPARALAYRAPPRTEARAFVDLQNDVTAQDIRLAVREGFESVEHVKRYTTTGMATDQGKTSNMTAIGLLAETLARPVPEVGTTTFRPPYTPVSFGALAGPARGALFEPVRKAPLHDWAAARGAVFEPVGQWQRARYFPRAGEDMRATVARECLAVRSAAGILDASTLGKIEVAGPDAAAFLNLLYINDMARLEPGRCRYGIMLREDGYIFDDGVVARLAADRFNVTTTTGGAAGVLAHMEEYLQTEWPDLRVFLTSVTEQWAVIGVQGPQARATIAPLVAGIDMSPSAFPHMAVRTGRIAGVPARLFRVSFTGEPGYEINVPSGLAEPVWNAICTGRESMVPYGTEAMHVLRAERGFIVVGQETDGTVTPGDVGLSGMIARGKPDFVGKRSLARPDLQRSDRKQLVGLLTATPDLVLEEGAQIVEDTKQKLPMRILGHVTSAYWSPARDRSIALALVASGRARHGQTLYVTTPSGFTAARVTEPVFFDPTGARVHG